MSPRARLPLLLGPLLVCLLGALWWQGHRASAPVEPGPTAQSGFWALDPEGAHRLDKKGGEDRARALSLPYTAGGAQVGTEGVGVVFHDAAHTWPGRNLYVSGHGAEAILVAMDGRFLRRWRYPFERAFPGVQPRVDATFFRRVLPLADGSVVGLYQGFGLVKLDADSNPLWVRPGAFFNHLVQDGDGRLYTLAKEAREIPALRDPELGPVLEDFLVILDLEGAELRRISILEALRRSPFADHLERRIPGADLLHSNTVVLLDPAWAGYGAAWQGGEVLLSLRELDLLVVLDLDTEVIVHALHGPWRRQHQPTPLRDGSLLLVDNRGYQGGARLLWLDPEDGTVRRQFPPEGDPPLKSAQAGSCAELPNGNILVVESERGRAFELTPQGQISWEFRSPHRAGPEGELVAYLFDVLRIPEDR